MRSNIRQESGQAGTIRKSFNEYIRSHFVYKESWTHPVTGHTFTCDEVKEAITRLKTYGPQFYKALWCLWSTGANRNFIAERLFISPSTLKRQWDKGTDVVLMLLLFPELEPENFSFYDDLQ